MTTTTSPGEPHPAPQSSLLPALVRLVWDGDPDCWYVRGHVEDALALASVREELLERLAEDGEDEGIPPELIVTRRAYARWQWPCASDDEVPGNGYTLAESAPGPGAFKVTVVRRLADVERDRAYRQHLRERPARSLATFAKLFPEATDARWHIPGDGTVPDFGEVRARFPGVSEEVAWREDHPNSLWPRLSDAETLKAWLEVRRAAKASAAKTTPDPTPQEAPSP
jgi:hypothetical protein